MRSGQSGLMRGINSLIPYMNKTIAFFNNHIESVIMLLIGLIIPSIIWFFNYYRHQILSEAEKTLNKATKRLDCELCVIKEKLTFAKENLNYVEDKQSALIRNIEKELDNIGKELEVLETLKIELQTTRETMSLQNNAFKQQIEDFKDFIKTHLLR